RGRRRHVRAAPPDARDVAPVRWYPARPVLAVLLWTCPGSAQTLVERVDLRGLFETELALESRDGGLQKWDWILTPEVEVRLSDRVAFTAIGRARIDPVDDLEPAQPPQDTRAAASRRLFVGDSTDLELREIYLDATLGFVFVRAGKQQVVWGQADGLRVLDAVNPLSFREFILPDFEDRRIPLWTLNAEVPVGPLTAQLLWIPDLTYDEPPETGAAFAFTTPRLVPRPPPGIPVRVRDPDKPNRIVLDSDAGVRLSAFLGGWDLTLNYLYHYQDQPVLRRSLDAAGIIVTPEYERTHLAGGTFSRAFGDLTLRAELAYSTHRFFLTESPADPDGVFHAGELGTVVGLDYSLDGDTLLSAQLFESILTAHPRGAVRDRADTQVTLLVQRELLNDTFVARALAIHSTNDGDGLAQLDLAYRLRSSVVLRAGYDFFYGSRNGLFGQFDQADRVTSGIEVGF
ncbi:MAG: DUF1302 family protein, partial [Candidatus Binatia bacterium]